MKKIALLLTLVLIVGMLSACGSANNTPSDSGSTPTTAATPTPEGPTNTPTPSPTPTPDPNCFFKCDFDSAPEGLFLKDATEENQGLVEQDPSLVYLLFGGIGSGMADFGKGLGVDGSNCLVCTGRTNSWNGISMDIDPKWYGKGFKISFDAKCVSMKEGVTDMLVSLTTQFQYIKDKEAGTASSTVYPAYNRITGTSSDGKWIHCEGTVFLPTDISGTTGRLYFECADGKGKEDILIDNLNVTVIDGVGDYEAFNAYWEEHKPAEEEPTE
ncbi:MAG: hypothetical protein J6Y10_02575 [Lachnospiraceae bacterium]|nr:hypothetical protein [Lachnospiraceae bacterium]